MSLEFVLATHNAKKVREFQRIIGERMPQAVVLPYDGPEPGEAGVTFEENALIKARALAAAASGIAPGAQMPQAAKPSARARSLIRRARLSPGSSTSEVEVRIVGRRPEARHQVGEDRAEVEVGRKGLRQ